MTSADLLNIDRPPIKSWPMCDTLLPFHLLTDHVQIFLSIEIPCLISIDKEWLQEEVQLRESRLVCDWGRKSRETDWDCGEEPWEVDALDGT